MTLLTISIWNERWTGGNVKGLVNVGRALVKIRETTGLHDLTLNFWEWSGIVNAECAIDVIV